MTTITDLKKVRSIADLKLLNIGYLQYDIGGRGGSVHYSCSDVAEHFSVDADKLTPKIGAYTNYLGGGLRGSITGSQVRGLSKRKTALVEALINACVRAYQNAEDELGMNDEEDEDGDINWEAKGTNAARGAGIVSAY